ncbi:hypothetical protein BZG36_00183 [Bifiguratus adelaidae]|uniref:N-acetyltransferase domain-containing protein n=1 Tax=Bifiguratus adelaidae TaxID=1938954 RepID=A0A261Y8D6_9FUNG|nr:hypothetical protein BZG36_00183 [Bifiguratus adelaidae]
MRTTDPSRGHKYYRWKEDICEYIENNWEYLAPGKTKVVTWTNTIASVLSTQHAVFLSGFDKFKQSGWWTLREESPPRKQNKKPRPKPSLALLQERPNKKAQTTASKSLKKEASQNQLSRLQSEDWEMGSPPVIPSLDAKELSETRGLSMNAQLGMFLSNYDNPFDTVALFDDIFWPEMVLDKDTMEAKHYLYRKVQRARRAKENAIVKSEPEDGMFSSAFPAIADRVVGEMSSTEEAQPSPPDNHVYKVHATAKIMSPYDEWDLLQKLENTNASLPASIKTFKRKLQLRRASVKRALGLALFNIDDFLNKQLNSSRPMEPIKASDVFSELADGADPLQLSQPKKPQLSPEEYREKLAAIETTPWTRSFVFRLYGSLDGRSMTSSEPWTASWRGRKLRPFIWRNPDCSSEHLRLLDDIKAAYRAREQRLQSIPSVADEISHGPIDYVHFQKQHRVAVNELLCRIFWPGIDDYPDYSVVALYKCIVIGCAFMTPAAYITFLAVAPGWEGAGVGQFMLYHLIQTSPGKDISLHVSANNPAMILYQKFGFKPEEFIVNFYDKYLPPQSTACKNAFLMRLRH